MKPTSKILVLMTSNIRPKCLICASTGIGGYGQMDGGSPFFIIGGIVYRFLVYIGIPLTVLTRADCLSLLLLLCHSLLGLYVVPSGLIRGFPPRNHGRLGPAVYFFRTLLIDAKLPPRLRRVVVPFVSRYRRRRAIAAFVINNLRRAIFTIIHISHLRKPLGSFTFCDNIVPSTLKTTTMNRPRLVPTLFTTDPTRSCKNRETRNG